MAGCKRPPFIRSRVTYDNDTNIVHAVVCETAKKSNFFVENNLK